MITVILFGSISFGLCVDDTIHLLNHYKKGNGLLHRLQHSVQVLSHPLTFTTILFCWKVGCEFLRSKPFLVVCVWKQAEW